jgi:hypothetical protein
MSSSSIGVLTSLAALLTDAGLGLAVFFFSLGAPVSVPVDVVEVLKTSSTQWRFNTYNESIYGCTTID